VTSEVRAPEQPPWQRSWWYVARGEWPTLAWIVGLHVVVLAAWCGCKFRLGRCVALSLVLLALGGLGTTVAYHRRARASRDCVCRRRSRAS
jgi:fatty-acid desaturase